MRIAGRNLEARTIRKGEFEKVDLALLEIDMTSLPPALGLRMMPVCDRPLRIGQEVVVATPQSLAHSRIMSPLRLPAELRNRFSTAIPDVATTGNSGSGVFDAEKQCLLGIMSRKIQIMPRPGTIAATNAAARDIGKYFVPSNEIRAFLGERGR